jgi:hypothetical protein
MKKGIVLAISVMMGLAMIGLATTTNIQTADAKGQCRDTADGIDCSGGIGTPPGGRGIHEEFGFDGSVVISGGFGEPGSNQELSNGHHCDSTKQRCVGDGFNSGQ